jgi:hypothetical protein
MHPQASAALLLLVAGACAKAPKVAPLPSPCGPGQRNPERGTWQFVAQSRPDSAMEGRFEGTATLENNWITLVVPRAMLTVPPGNSENWRNLTVRAFFATDYCSGTWKAVAQARPVNVFRFIDFGSTKWTERRTLPIEEPLRFVVPIPPGAAFSTSRLAFEIEWVYVFGTFGDTESRFAFSGPIEFTSAKKP